MHVANTFRTWNGPPKFCIELKADWLIILDEVRRKSPGLDQQLKADQQLLRKQNHPHSQSSKNPKGRLPKNSLVIPGDIVYLYADKDSSRARSRYLVSAVDGEWCIIRKFAGNQLRNVTYCVKRNECYAVPPDNNLFDSVEDRDYSD